MKRPKKIEWMDSNPPTKSKEGEEENEGVRRVRIGFKAKRERRQGSSSATMCQVCNIRLNSSAQAQIHYKGKTHQRRLRRLAKTVNAGRNTLFYTCFSLFMQAEIHFMLLLFIISKLFCIVKGMFLLFSKRFFNLNFTMF